MNTPTPTDRVFLSRLPRPWVTIVLLIGILILLRLPSILYPHEINPDESQMLSQGMKFLVDPRPWKAVDGTTAGPLNSYFLTLFLLIGFRPGFILLHAVATLLAGFQIVLAHRTLLLILSEKAAALGALLVTLLYGIAGSTDYLHYASELFPSVLLGFAFYALAARLEGTFRKHFHLLLMFLAGLALGSAPWGKLQAGPIAAALGFFLLAAILFRRSISFVTPPISRTGEAIALCLGTILPTATILGFLAKTGALHDFWYSYVLNNVAYTDGFSIIGIIRHSLRLCFLTPLNQPLMIALVGMVYLHRPAANQWLLKLFPKDRWVLAGVLTYVGAGFFAASRGPRVLHHHGNFLVLPLIYAAMVPVAPNLNSLTRDQQPFSKWRKRFGLVACIATIALYTAWAVRQVSWIIFRPQTDANEKITAVILDIERTRTAKSLAIWGWTPAVYVHTGIPPATRDSIAQFAIDPGPYREYYRERFLNDLREKKPDLFLDAAVPGTIAGWTSKDGYEADPELKKFINDNYSLVAELPLLTNATPVRFFARNPAASASNTREKSHR